MPGRSAVGVRDAWFLGHDGPVYASASPRGPGSGSLVLTLVTDSRVEFSFVVVFEVFSESRVELTFVVLFEVFSEVLSALLLDPPARVDPSV